MKKTNTTITIATYQEMNVIKINSKVVFNGSVDDFYSGCIGTKIGGYDVSGLWDQGVLSLATALKVKIEETGKKVTIIKKELTFEECKKMRY